MRCVTAVVVNWNSGEDLATVVTDLAAQTGVALSIIVVDNGSRDQSVASARATGVQFDLDEAGANLGYTGGNNRGAARAGVAADVLVVNPDVRLPDPRTVAHLAAALDSDPTLAAVAPAIEVRTGALEYLGSEIDLDHARAVHVDTDVAVPALDQPRVLSWIDGAVMLVRAKARADFGLFDDRFFLIYDEVDWCIRATNHGWRVALCPGVQVRHQRSSSFEGSSKGGYYYWRNLYMLCRLHAPTRWKWRWHYGRRLAEFVTRHEILLSGYAFVVLRGAFAGVRGHVGPGPADSRRQP